MSLLMDALKKAELAKRQAGEGAEGSDRVHAEDDLALEPIADSSATRAAAAATGNASTPASLPSLPAHLEELDAQFLAEAQQAASARLRPPPPSPAPPREPPAAPAPTAADAPARAATTVKPRQIPDAQNTLRNQSAAQNLFAVKQPGTPIARKKAFALAIGVFTTLALCAIGGYFWWQLQPKSAPRASRATLPAAPAATAVAPLAAVPPAPTLAAAPVAHVAEARAANPATDDKDDEPAAVAVKAPPQARRAAAARTAAARTAPTEAEGPIHVTKAPLKVDPALLRGFDAFNRGDLALAQIEYERARKSDPRNTDALHGLAAIALRQGRADQAEWLYRQIAEADPQDTMAMSALINMRGQIDPGAAESRLKSLSAAQPELAAPQFSLGNLYARQGRWNEAQQAYFRAYSAEPTNPDILYNLAISLEHLRQNKLAAQYYSQAIAAAQTRPAGFDKTQATARLRTLQP